MELTITLTGTNPLLMHNERLANPFDPIVEQMAAITSKRKKTNDDRNDIARLEHEGGLYMNDNGPFVPTWNVKKCFIEAGRLNKLGKHIERAFAPLQPDADLIYDGPRDAAGMWKARMIDMRAVRIGTSKTMRCRPRFNEWALSFQADVDTQLINLQEFALVTERAGRMIGLCDFRGRFGRFTVEIVGA